MLTTSARLLDLLSLFQLHRTWSGAELADRLNVSTRTVRTDIDRLRELGYPVLASRGVAGGYRLGSGARLPPLLLDDDEAVAVAVGLRTATGGGVSGLEEVSVRALAKLEQVLPARLRHRVQALQEAVTVVQGGGVRVDPDQLTTAARAIQASERLRFDYRTADGATTRREIEPYRLVAWGRRWYLVGWDDDREDWRIFRLDRMSLKTPNGRRFVPREPPQEDLAAYVHDRVSNAPWAFRARVRVQASVDYVRARIPSAPTIEPDGKDHCLVEVGSDDPGLLVHYLGLLERDFTVLDSPALVSALTHQRDRLTRAIDASAP